MASSDGDRERLLSSLFTSMSTGVYATDTVGRVLLINPAALRLLGLAEADVVGRSMHELVHDRTADGAPLPAASCPLLSVIATGTPARSDDDTFWCADGVPLPVSWISAPVIEHDEVTGAVVVFSDATTLHFETERLLAQHRATLDEHEATVAAHARLADSADRLALLGRVSEAMATLDTDQALRRLARLTAGPVADWCVVDAVDAGAVRRVAVASNDPTAAVQAGDGRPAPALTPTATGPLARALLTDAQQTRTCSPGSALSSLEGTEPLDVEQARLLDELGCAHALVTPLSVRRSVLGAMTWVRTDPSRPFTEQEEFLAAEIGRRAGVAVQNARLYGQQRAAAVALQRSLLTVLPEPDHLHIVARYLPASDGVEIGGDWYDAFVLDDGATNLVIGDILGHDLAAAAHMGQVRNLLRGIAADRLQPPSEVVARLDRALRSLDVGALATCLLGRIEQSPEHAEAGLRTLRWSSAGHLPPVVVDEQGQVRFLDEPGDLMLGVDAELPRHDSTTTIAPGETVWLYTDGLVERSDQPLDEGLERLCEALAAGAHLPLERACDVLLERMLPSGHPDDVALLAVRAHPEDRPRPAEAGPAHPSS